MHALMQRNNLILSHNLFRNRLIIKTRHIYYMWKTKLKDFNTLLYYPTV
ncbi:hypothetical protein ABID22_002704 [Pontibacter aydingkolensis]